MAGHWDPIYYANAPVGGEFDLQSLSLAYECLLVLGAGLRVTTDQSWIAMQFRIAGSLQSGASDYDWGLFGQKNAQVQDDDYDEDADKIMLTLNVTAANSVGNAATEHMGFQAYIFNPNSTSLPKHVITRSQWLDSAGDGWQAGGGARLKSTSAIDGIRIFGQSALTHGRISVFGMKTS